MTLSVIHKEAVGAVRQVLTLTARRLPTVHTKTELLAVRDVLLGQVSVITELLDHMSEEEFNDADNHTTMSSLRKDSSNG